MIRGSTFSFPPSIYDPPPEAPASAPALNLQLGNVNVSLGGAGTTGVYRSGARSGAGIQSEGIRDGVRSFMGRVKEGVDRIASQS